MAKEGHQFAGNSSYPYHVCKQTLVTRYCGSCDEYYNGGHDSDCKERKAYRGESDHDNCTRWR